MERPDGDTNDHDDHLDHDDHDGDHDHGAIVLRASGAKWVWVLIGSLAFALFGAALALSVQTGVFAKGIGWVLLLMFGFCAVVSVRELRAPGSLAITKHEIDIIRRGRLTTFALADCGPFSAWRSPSKGTIMVVFDYVPDGDTDLARMNRQLMGGSRALIDAYGVSTDQLVELLNQARAAGLAER